MAKAAVHPYAEGKQQVVIFCPACQCIHAINDAPRAWGFNGDIEKPTFEGSIGFHGEDSGGVYCHSEVKDGKITFYSDSQHDKAGQTFDLPDMPEIYQ